MRRQTGHVISDAGFLLFIVLSFICILFVSGTTDGYLSNILLLNAAILIAIVTYFTTVTAGLVLNIIFVFAYGTYILYVTLVEGRAIDGSEYFWLFVPPLYTAVVWMMTYGSRQIQEENMRLRRQNSSLATLDDSTNLRNSRSYQRDAATFMALSKRYHIPLTLLVINVRHWDELKRLISEEEVASVVNDLSKLSETSIRTNDSLYMLDKDIPTWGMLLFTDRPGAGVVIDRLKQSVAEFNEVSFADKYRIALDLRTGAVTYDPETIQDPLSFVVQAKKQLEYDV